MKIERTKRITKSYSILSRYNALRHSGYLNGISLREFLNISMVHSGVFNYLFLAHLSNLDLIETISFDLEDEEIYLGTFKEIMK